MQQTEVDSPSDPVIEIVRGDDNVRDALKAHPNMTAATPFQTQAWLDAVFRNLTETNSAEPCLVCVRRARNTPLVMALPLIIARQDGLITAGFPDYGIADYGAPLISNLEKGAELFNNPKALWRNICLALADVDRIFLSNMPNDFDNKPNPFASLRCSRIAAHQRFVVEIKTTVKDHIAERGKKYRKEVERCLRLLDAAGDWTFACASGDQQKKQAFEDLNQLQKTRWIAQAEQYNLNLQGVENFYRQLLLEKATGLQSYLFTLKSGTTTIAALYGVQFGESFTLLRIADAGKAWRRLSPGRLIVLEVMRHFVSQGIRTFDLGIGDYSFKRGLGAKALPLIEVDQAMTLKAKPHAMLMQAKGWVRKHPQLKRVLKRARQKMSSKA